MLSIFCSTPASVFLFIDHDNEGFFPHSHQGKRGRGLMTTSQLEEEMVWGWRSSICYSWMIPSFFTILVRRT